MSGRRFDPYRSHLAEFIPDREAHILVCAAGSNDRDVYQELGYRRVTMANLDPRMNTADVAPYSWSHQDTHNLTFADDSFDYAVTHASLHHCRSPHRALLEMYRVARIGVLVFEARDSFTMRLIERLHITQTYEHAAVYYNDCRFGGVDGTQIPNFVYRWTEREIEKTIHSYNPVAPHRFEYRYDFLFPLLAKLERGARLKRLGVRAALLPYLLYVKLFPRQRNRFCFYVEKPKLPEALHPWLRLEDGQIVFNRAWGNARYNPELPPELSNRPTTAQDDSHCDQAAQRTA